MWTKFSFLWDKCPGMQLLGCMESVRLIFKRTAKLISRVAAPYCVRTNNVNSLHSCQHFVLLVF